MTRICTLLFFLVGTANIYAEEVPESVTAEEGHGPINPYRASGMPVNIQQAQIMAAKVRDAQVHQGDLARSWIGVKVKETKQRTFQNEKEWVVIFTNPAETNIDQKTLYIFLDLYGDVVDVNFTGN